MTAIAEQLSHYSAASLAASISPISTKSTAAPIFTAELFNGPDLPSHPVNPALFKFINDAFQPNANQTLKPAGLQQARLTTLDQLSLELGPKGFIYVMFETKADGSREPVATAAMKPWTGKFIWLIAAVGLAGSSAGPAELSEMTALKPEEAASVVPAGIPSGGAVGQWECCVVAVKQDAAYRGKGLARELMTRAEREAVRRYRQVGGEGKVKIAVRYILENAPALWEKSGFVRESDETLPAGTWGTLREFDLRTSSRWIE